MCSRRSCCGQSGGQGAGIAAAAVLIVAAALAAKIGHTVAKITHIAIEVFRIAALTAVAVVALAVLVWLTVMIARWWLRHRAATRQTAFRLVIAPVEYIAAEDDRPGCLGCGGSRTVLRAIDGGRRYQARGCPVCGPAERAG
jgi:hypothetical protein